jgi:CheY-like chemotaxis protein
MGSGKPFSVLIADDNQDAADSLATLLGLHGYVVKVVYTGPAAVTAALADPPDCAILDIGLPGLDGCAVARELRAHPATAAVKLVAFSGYSDAEIGSAATDAGFDHHLVKGRADPQDFGRILSTLADVREMVRAAASEIREVREELREVKAELAEVKDELREHKADAG